MLLPIIIIFLVFVIPTAGVVPYIDKEKKQVPGIVSFHSNKDRYIRCEFCRNYPHIVKQYVPKKPPAITSIEGTRFYARVLAEHLETAYHKECARSYRISTIEENEGAPMDSSINRANKLQVDRVGKLMIQVYIDAKRLNLPPWPSRYVAGEASFAYDSNNQNKSIVADNINLQYVNAPSHLSLMTAIASSDQKLFHKKIKDCIAMSLRIDGSIDFTHIDKIYVMAKLINMDGKSELFFIGIAEQTQRLATGLMNAVKEALKAMGGDLDVYLRKISSMCTDGTNLNSGERNGLWVLLENEMKAAGSTIPLIKIWCAAHRAELAWKNAANSVGAVSKLLSILSKISTHFHYSAIRTAELKKTASDRSLEVFSYHGRHLSFISKKMRKIQNVLDFTNI